MFQTTTFLYLFALRTGLDIEASALSMRNLTTGPALTLVPANGPAP